METAKNMLSNFLGMKFKELEITCAKHGKLKAMAAIYADGTEICNCPECEKEAEAAAEEQKRQEEKALLYEKYQESNIEKEFWNKTLKDFHPDTPSQNHALMAVTEMINKHSGKVILLGNNGVGKTMLGSCAVKEMGGKILSMYEISTMIRQSYTARAEKTELEIVKELASIPFLVIDELGRTKGSDAELNWLSYVLDKRHVRNLPFMILSNTHLKKDCKENGCSCCFENYLNNDILSRLRENSRLIIVEGDDYRNPKLKKN